MNHPPRETIAFGKPGIEPRWTRGNKDAVGTAYSASSRLWFTLSAGMLNEVYFPTIDQPQIRDHQYLTTDGETFFHDERRHLDSSIRRLSPHALGYEITGDDRKGRYRIIKQVIADPHHACVLIHTRLEVDESLKSKLRLFSLLAPHLGGSGSANNGHSIDVTGRTLQVAHKDDIWLATAASIPFVRRSCGYVGLSDGWTDLATNNQMDWEFDAAADGNIALTGELDLRIAHEFTLGLAFGYGQHNAVTTLLQSLGVPFSQHRERFIEQWERSCRNVRPVSKHVLRDGGHLYHASHSLLLSHEDKTYPGAMIASSSIPWGEARGDDDIGGYHLVWTRDMVNSATGLLAAGDLETPLRSLIYLACSQQPEGGFHQNFWINGDSYWTGIQLDEVAFPILLAWRLHEAGALQDFDPYPMVLRAAGYLVRQGPSTPQERWEESSGYSPSTLASNIAALTCAASFANGRGDHETARFLQEYADFLECHVEAWTVTSEGTLVPEIPRHFIRIHPVEVADFEANENPNLGTLLIKNRGPGQRHAFPARDIIDAGFLELVRYGIRQPGDPLFEDSLRVVDSVLKVDTPHGPCWRRYNHDGYGQREDGGPYEGWGKGRAWPLLTGERGHYELAAGRDVAPYLRALESFANPCGLLPEQIWDEADRAEAHLQFGSPTGAAMPLMWAHAEYIKLLRSASDGKIFDLIPAVVDRYQCQAPSKTEPEATRKLSHLDPSGPIEPAMTPVTPDAVVTPQEMPSMAGVGFGVVQASRARAPRGLIGLEGAMQTPEEVLVMQQLLQRGWSRRRIAAELGISRNTLNRYLAIGDWQPYSSANRSGQLDGHREWLQQQFEQHHGNAEVVRQELVKQKGIRVSLRTVERAVQAWREALRQSRQATVRYETRPGKQLQADFGELWVPIGGVRTKVHICVLTLGYSRRQLIRVYRHQRQRYWLQALEEAFRFWEGIPEEVLVDNAKALITLNKPRTRELVINPTFAAFARHWGFTPKACWPNRPQTKGKDERGVGYVKRSGIAGHRFDTWGQMESHLEWWNREIADVRIHGTTGERPLDRFQGAEAAALMALNGKPSYLAEQEFSRRVARDCCVQVEGNWYSVPAALVRQNVTVQIRDQQVVIRQGGRIVARHTRQEANQRSRQVIAGHWAGLVPQRAIEAAQADGLAEVVTLDAVRRSSLARPLSDYAAVVAEVG